MRAFFKTLALAVSLAPVAAAAERSTFTRDGTTYTYSVTQVRNARIIEGTGTDGNRYRLVVANGWVTGTSGAMSVRFRVRDVATTARSTTAETASR